MSALGEVVNDESLPYAIVHQFKPHANAPLMRELELMLPPSGRPWGAQLFPSAAQRLRLASNFPSSKVGAGGLMLHRNAHNMAAHNLIDPADPRVPLPAAAHADACDEPAYRPCAVRSAEALCGAAWRALDAKGFVYRAGQQLFP